MSELTFYERVNELQNELVAPKSNYNNFGKYKYRSAEDILEAVKPLNQKHGVILFLSDEPIFIGDWHYIKATARLVDAKDSNNQIEATAYARESHTKKGMDDSQITGTASSYARKYALNGLYLIDDTKDADTDEYQKQSDKKPQHTDTVTEDLMKKFSEASQCVGGASELYKQLETTKNDVSKLIKSNKKKEKEQLIEQLEGIIHDFKHAG